MDDVTYYDDVDRWVLGQIASTSVTGLMQGSTVATVQFERTEFDARSLPWKYFKFGQLVQVVTYNADGTVATVEDGAGNVTTFADWKRGVPRTITWPDGTSVAAAVSDGGEITSTTSETLAKHCYEYDAMGRVAGVVPPSEIALNLCQTGAEGGAGWAKIDTTFGPVAVEEFGVSPGHWRQIATNGSRVTETYYDAFWRPLVIREYDAAAPTATQRFVRYAYDSRGRTTFQSYPSSSPSATSGIWSEYDGLGRPKSVAQDSERGLLVTRVEYLAGGARRTTDPSGNATTEYFQAFGEPSFEWPIQVDLPERTRTMIIRDVFGKPLRIERGSRN
ncbi:MAG TPA: hypothetical protein VFE72_03915 [Lysobacter sp.]|nr:hypothetical protein [Lysobacter sp.]